MIGLLKGFMWVCVDIRFIGQLWKRWIDSVNDCLKKRSLNVSQARRIVYDKNEWKEFLRGECLGYSLRDEPLTLMRCYSCGLSQLYETLKDGG